VMIDLVKGGDDHNQVQAVESGGGVEFTGVGWGRE
jgi:hypothetical protein